VGFIFFILISSVNTFCRQASGANIKIADLDEGSQDRHVTISGTPEQIQLAEFLIHSR
jgi:poly(rC)-binding protein 2/3/4